MTGFASIFKEYPAGRFNVILRSVNYRYLDIQLRLPDNFRIFEPMLREMILAKMVRGKMECRILLDLPIEEINDSEINEVYLQELLKLSNKIHQFDKTLQHLSVSELLRWPGVLRSRSIDFDMLKIQLINAMNEALEQFNESRQIEGKKIQHFLLSHAKKMLGIIQMIQNQMPAILENYTHKLNRRLKEALEGFDDERIKQEFVLFAQKIDIEEEIERLRMHLAEIIRIASENSVAGKQLDFLMQELNREANTLSTKSMSGVITHQSVELKILIEQMREQIQNIE